MLYNCILSNMNAPLDTYAVLALLILFVIFYRIEKINHQRNRNAIATRIWVNGTRGKSSVTRLIAAGLKAGAKKVIAKTTGTSPRFIMNNNVELPVIRLGTANIREQIKTMKKASNKNPDAIVLECMALRPDLQLIESLNIIKPTAVVITNVRPDHLDVMGPTVKDIAKSFIKAIPKNCLVFIAESPIFNDFLGELSKKNIEYFTSKASDISNTIMEKFSYIEHKENVALALGVCTYLGVDEKAALKGMQNARPDPGALRRYTIDLDGKEITLVYAMAANDPESTYLIWQSIDKNFPQINILVNCRNDRIDRSFQFAKLIKERLRANHYILTGSGTDVLAKKIYKTIDRSKVLDLGGKKPKEVIREVARFVGNKSLIFAIGNTVGYGEEMIRHFLMKQKEASC